MYNINIDDKIFKVNLDSSTGKDSGKINGSNFKIDIAKKNDSQYHVIKNDKSYCIDVLDVDFSLKIIKLKINGQVYEGTIQNDLDILLKKMGIENKSKSIINELHAPMPGMVLSVKVQKGQKVKKGDTLLVLEAMKMENNLKAESEVVVKDIHCEIGDTVDKNQLLISYE